MKGTRLSRSQQLFRLQSSLTDRDYQIINWLYDHSLLTTEQIAHALFPSLRSCQNRLLYLHSRQLIDRFRPFKMDGGSFPYFYVIGQLGLELVAGQRGDAIPRPDQASQRRIRLTSKTVSPHLIGVNQFFIDLAAYARVHDTAQLRQWLPATSFYERGFIYGLAGTSNDDVQVMLRPAPRPDGYGVWAEEQATVSFFLEYDTGTESIGTLIEKIQLYQNLRRPDWPVLFSLSTERRERNLHQAITRQPIGLRAVVATAARDRIKQLGLTYADAVWWRHGTNDSHFRPVQLVTMSQKEQR